MYTLFTHFDYPRLTDYGVNLHRPTVVAAAAVVATAVLESEVELARGGVLRDGGGDLRQQPSLQAGADTRPLFSSTKAPSM